MRPAYFTIVSNKSQVEIATFSCLFLWILLYLRGEYSKSSPEVFPMKTKTWILLLVLLLLACIGMSIPLLFPGESATHAEILSDGQVLRLVDLRVDQVFTVPAFNGGHNTVTVKDGKIAVTEATCPDHYCMHRGFCDSGAQIVCLPNRLVIRFTGDLPIDAVAG